MRYFLSVIVIVCVVFIGAVRSQAVCSYTITNCLTEELSTCAYDDSGFWYTIYSYSGSTLESGDTDFVDYGCNNTTSAGCYVIGEEDPSVWLCQEYDVDGFVACSEYACVDDSDGITWHSGDSEYSCSDNTCVTD